MSGSTIEAMRSAVEMAGGRLGENEYLDAVKGLIEADGGTTSIDSLKTNAFNSNRMAKAGVVRVTVGKTKQVWLSEMGQSVLEGKSIGGMTTNVTPVTASSLTGGEAPAYGTYYGVPIRGSDEFPSWLNEKVPPVVGFVESGVEENRLLATSTLLSLSGDFENCHVMAEGPKGCGKSLMARDFFANTNTPVLRLNMSEGVTEDSFIGMRTLEDGNVAYVHGVLPLAMMHGIPLILDEVNAARENVNIALNSAMDSGQLLIPENGNELVIAQPGFMVIGTMNPPDDYAGVNDMNQATRDRFTLNLTFDYLGEQAEVEVIQAQSGFLNRSVALEFVRLANDLRRLKRDRKMETDTSTRTLGQMLVLVKNGLSVKEVVDLCLVGKYGADEREDVKMAARARLSDYAAVTA